MLAISRERGLSRMGLGYCLLIAVIFSACSTRKERPQAPYVPLSQVESVFGHLITAGNHPTPDQMGTGDRVGLFRDSSGTIWGLPMATAGDGSVLVCAPAAVRDAPTTDHYPADLSVIGATNEPTRWRGGSGKLELLLRAADGNIRWQAVSGSHIDVGPACWPKIPPGRSNSSSTIDLHHPHRIEAADPPPK